MRHSGDALIALGVAYRPIDLRAILATDMPIGRDRSGPSVVVRSRCSVAAAAAQVGGRKSTGASPRSDAGG